MSTISPALVPTIPPGQLFYRFTTDDTISVRWLTSEDPVYFDVTNRPMADIALRQLILAKAIDVVNLRLGFLSRFPFLTAATITASTRHELPANWIWDMHVSLPAKWQSLRLAKIKRVSGHNDPGTGGSGGEPVYDGKLRLVFTAVTALSTTETAVFEVDYVINSPLSWQIMPVQAVEPTEESAAIDPAEAATIAGYLIFRTLDYVNDSTVRDFYNLLAPPTGGSEDSHGEYVTPTVYELDDSTAGSSVTDDFSPVVVSHGTGMLVVSAYNLIPATDSDANVWLEAFNYPFTITADRTSVSPVTIQIPKALFAEFDVSVPAGDGPLSDTTGLFFPVWISRIEKLAAGKLNVVFSTYNVTDGAPSTVPIEFASLVLESTWLAGRIVPITPLNNLQLQGGADAALFGQHFGRGHGVLSAKWAAGNVEVAAFFNAFNAIIDFPPNALYDQESTRISSFGLSRVPKYAPTIGQSQALVGTAARRATPLNPSDDNRYVTEQDQGLGDRFDFQTCTELDPAKRSNPDIDRYGYKGGLVSKGVTLIVNGSGTQHDYETDILPRLKCLLGRSPASWDHWFDGTRVKTYVITADGEGVWVG